MRERAALTIYATLLGGSMGSRLFEEIREKRGLCYSVYALDHAFADVPILQLGSGLESSKCDRGLHPHARDRRRAARRRADRGGGAARSRLRRRPPGARVREHQRGRPLRANQQIVFGEDIDPDAAIAALDAVTYEEVREVAAGVADELAVACVGPHSADEF